MRNPFSVAYEWLLLNYIRVLLAAEGGCSDGTCDDCEAEWAERAKADFIVHGGDVEFIQRVEEAFDVEFR